jgi:uroporphyrinogen decarboxylase
MGECGKRMNSKQRVLSAIARQGWDRIPVMYQGEPVVTQRLQEHFGATDFIALQERLGDDLRYVQPVWIGPQPQCFPDGTYQVGYPDRGWPMVGERVRDIPTRFGVHPEVVYRPFEGVTDPAELDGRWFPSADCFDYGTIREQCRRYPGHALVTGTAGILSYICCIGHVRGIEQTLVDMASASPVLLRLLEIKQRFHMAVFERVLQAGEGLIDIVYCGEDLGSQNDLLIGPRTFDRLLAPRFAEFFDLAHRYQAKVMLHSCGSVRRLIPRLIELGLDILQVVQTSAAGMDIRELHDQFGDRLTFCGSMDVQTILPNSTVPDIRREVELRRQLFADGGLILGPTHTIEPDTPLENVLEMYRAAGSLEESGH